jgi:hypothetical protein
VRRPFSRSKLSGFLICGLAATPFLLAMFKV